MEIFVRNISFACTEDDIRGLFDGFGRVERVTIISDRETGRSRGFGFVAMPNEDEGRSAIEGLNGHVLDGRELGVNEARPRQTRPDRRRW